MGTRPEDGSSGTTSSTEYFGGEEVPSFALFRQYHRYCLEQHSAIHPWDARIQALGEREANGRGLRLEDSRVWDAFHSQILGPLHNAFWIGWELVWELERLYTEQRNAEMRRQSEKLVLKVFARPETPRTMVQSAPDDVEQAQWEGLADRLFEEMCADDMDELWVLPAADSVVAELNRPSE